MTVVAVVGIALFMVIAQTGTFFGRPSQSTGQSSQSTAGPDMSYDCARPANATEWSCDQLPAGYQIAPKLVNVPDYTCPAKMTQSACELMQRTYGNGVCDPNETLWTNPLDCGCSGSQMGDTWLGRCGNPAQSCMLTPLNQTAP